MLHASAVQFGKRVVLLVGPSHAGKSTLAASFHQIGHLAVSDEIVRIKNDRTGARAFPSYGGLRLWEDSLNALFGSNRERGSTLRHSAKKRVELGRRQPPRLTKGVPIAAVIVLSPTSHPAVDEISLSPLSLREAYVEIGKQAFVLDVNPGTIGRQMKTVARLVAKSKSFRLSLPHDYARLGEARKRILEVLA